MGDRSATIDELLGRADRADGQVVDQRRPGRSVPGRLARILLAAGAVAGAVVVGLRMVGLVVPFGLVLSGALALFVLRRALRAAAAPPAARGDRHDPAPGAAELGEYRWGGGDGLRAAVHRWETRLEHCQHDPDRFARVVAPRLGELIDERLRQRHGLTRASDPRRARQLLGEPLWTLVAGPVRRVPGQRDLAVLIAQVEAL